METKMAVAGEASMTLAEVKAQVNLIQQIMENVMQGPSKENPEGVHYGIIPGTKKNTLYKAGAEKLARTFKLRPIIKEEGGDIRVNELSGGHREVFVYCHIFNVDGSEIATGIGSCSTMETKHRYRGGLKIATGKPVPKEYWNLKNEGKWKEAQAVIGGQGFGTMKGDNGYEICELGEKAENPDIADVYNTVLKMAKKRAFVDGIITATASSDIFTQDEDLIPEGESKEPPKEGKPATTKPESTEATAKASDATVIPEISGEVLQIKPNDYKSTTKNNDGKVIPAVKHKTEYHIKNAELGEIVIQEWRIPLEGLVVGDSITALEVKIGEYPKGTTTYTAKAIEKEIPFGNGK